MGWLKRAKHTRPMTHFIERKWICWFLLIALFAFHEGEVGDLQARPFTGFFPLITPSVCVLILFSVVAIGEIIEVCNLNCDAKLGHMMVTLDL
ncbi:hypothetical protein Gorai_016519 [Gossypium raimondii]|uniref:Uncharacterized protein n=1 Tax=Gossypium raimondii TaxID=29730 RepID=A0A7J8P997_GOSRA|nr:hypothetical protein [Gossypium raimondii]